MNADFSTLISTRREHYPNPEREHDAITNTPTPSVERLPSCPVAGLEPCSLIDFPGHIAAVIFLAACNLNCGYCHNRALINPSTKREVMGISGLLAFLKERSVLLDGVVISGGEPCLHPELEGFIRLIRMLGYKIKLDTNGTRPELLAALLEKGMLDYVAMDIKAPPQDPMLYARICDSAVDIQAIRQSMALIRAYADSHHQFGYEFRTTVCEGLDVQDLMGIAASIVGSRCYAMQVCRPGPGLPSSTLEELATLISTMYGIPKVIVR